jgi:hypothetical protein
MFDFLFNSIWGWLGIGGSVIAACVAIGWFFPPFRKLAWTIAGATAGVLAIYTKGAADAKRRERERQAAAERKAVERGNKARADAERDVRTGRVRDKWDRDDI